MDEALALEAKITDLEDEARKLGLYLEQAAVMAIPPGVTRLMARFTIGEVAWSKRVQDPEADDINKRLAEAEAHMADDEFLDTREQMKRNLAAGRDPLDDGDDA